MPDLSRAWHQLEEWFRAHPRAQFVEVGRLARELPEVGDVELALALQALARRGYVRQVYRVATPEGDILDRNFESPTDVPDQMPDRFYRTSFQTSEGDIVPGFLLESSGAER